VNQDRHQLYIYRYKKTLKEGFVPGAKYQLQQVLSPRQFLPKAQQQLPRSDQRKEDMKVRLKQILYASKTFESFEQKVKEWDIDIIKGRGIAFIDSKGVKVKGSDMGLSLQNIEKQIEKNNRQVWQKQTRFIQRKQRENTLGL
jgi:hypothetical protein